MEIPECYHFPFSSLHKTAQFQLVSLKGHIPLSGAIQGVLHTALGSSGLHLSCLPIARYPKLWAAKAQDQALNH